MYGCCWKRPGKEAKQGCVLKEQLVNGRLGLADTFPGCLPGVYVPTGSGGGVFRP